MELQKVIDLYNCLTVVFDLEWRVLHISQSFLRYFKKERLEELIPKLQQFSFNQPFSLKITNYQGKTYQLQGKKVKIEDKIFVVFDDITALERVRSELSHSQKLLKEYQEAVDAFAIVSKTDPNGVITYVNTNFERISGYTKAELIGKSHNIIRHPKMPSYVYKKMWRTIQSGKIWRGVVRNLSKLKKEYYVELLIMPILENGVIKEYFGIGINVTKLIRAKERAQRAKRQRSIFLANMSHEIRTPLTAILGFIDILRQKDLSQENKQILDIIAKSSGLLLDIVNDILDFSKIQRGQVIFHLKPFNPKESFAAIADLFRSKARDKGIEYQVDIDLDVACIVADEQKIKQVLGNLIGNAIKFTPEGGRVKVKIEQKRKKGSVVSILFMVEDSGIGIDPKHQQKIFKPFIQAEDDTGERFGGTGLGLAISQSIVKKLGGEIKVQSQKGKGSAFSFLLDFKECHQVSKKEEKKQQYRGSVLVVDDNETNRALLQTLLELYGDIEVTLAKNGYEALEQIKRQDFDLVLLDIEMPGLDGIKTLERIKKIRNQSVVALTAHVGEQERRKFLNVGFDDYLQKPLESEALQKVLSRFLEPIEEEAAVLDEIELRKIRELYFQNIFGEIEVLKELYQLGKYLEASKQAHKIAGSSGNLGFNDIYETAKQIERSLKERKDIKLLLKKLEEFIHRMKQEERV